MWERPNIYSATQEAEAGVKIEHVVRGSNTVKPHQKKNIKDCSTQISSVFIYVK